VIQSVEKWKRNPEIWGRFTPSFPTHRWVKNIVQKVFYSRGKDSISWRELSFTPHRRGQRKSRKKKDQSATASSIVQSLSETAQSYSEYFFEGKMGVPETYQAGFALRHEGKKSFRTPRGISSRRRRRTRVLTSLHF